MTGVKRKLDAIIKLLEAKACIACEGSGIVCGWSSEGGEEYIHCAKCKGTGRIVE